MPERAVGRADGVRPRRDPRRSSTAHPLGTANRACYTPRPTHRPGSALRTGRTGTAHVGTSGAFHGRGPARPRAAARAAADRPRARVEGPAAPVGPRLPPDVLVPRELPGRPDPRLHRPLLAAGRRRPRPVLRARHDTPPGLRRGPDRRRQRPQPVRPPADRGQGRAGDPGAGDDPPGPAPPGLERELARAGWPSASAHLGRARQPRTPWSRPPDRTARRSTAPNPSRSRSPWPSTRGRSASSCSSGRRSASTTGPTASSRPR